jgi:hypothetical protein
MQGMAAVFWLDVVASPALLPQGKGDLNEAKEPYEIRRSGGMGIATDNAEHDVMLHRATLSFVTCRGGGVNTHGPKREFLLLRPPHRSHHHHHLFL